MTPDRDLQHFHKGIETRSWAMLAKWVVGYEGRYLVYRDGRVVNANAREMTVSRDRSGYATVRLSLDGRQSCKRVNRLVCEAFNGPPFDGAHAAHRDGNLNNNDAGNLAWKAPRENNADKIAHGTHQAGARHPRVKLTADQVEEIRASGLSSRTLARMYRISQPHVVRIRNRSRWGRSPAKPASLSQGGL